MGSMISILAVKANSFAFQLIAFSVDSEDYHFCSEKIVNVKRQINLEVDNDQIQELLDLPGQELTKDLIEMHEQEQDNEVIDW
ncbi:hypothetical protein TNCV_3402941 [Trichonephila clavipes]|nr:hypothetical protein TNCV_3402941 [Trichonephila clavipes]